MTPIPGKARRSCVLSERATANDVAPHELLDGILADPAQPLAVAASEFSRSRPLPGIIDN
ncbi:hypothetical protein BOSEA31B_12360 [Hyphomicrobiales bacterium]|nr:hypothetical protein BOSEA31B_12360 [Hyphomicrobiales bacterium]CAH1698139.1 hypothetical protein BOSEA1005_11184 [Hyphomicrobiales bacterium]CAI0347782.1 hypothetical protein BO1005MUT1_90143 [Hyphomicrobiales bacterium]